MNLWLFLVDLASFCMVITYTFTSSLIFARCLWCSRAVSDINLGTVGVLSYIKRVLQTFTITWICSHKMQIFLQWHFVSCSDLKHWDLRILSFFLYFLSVCNMNICNTSSIKFENIFVEEGNPDRIYHLTILMCLILLSSWMWSFLMISILVRRRAGQLHVWQASWTSVSDRCKVNEWS